jgi:hypothetical protein
MIMKSNMMLYRKKDFQNNHLYSEKNIRLEFSLFFSIKIILKRLFCCKLFKTPVVTLFHFLLLRLIFKQNVKHW